MRVSDCLRKSTWIALLAVVISSLAVSGCGKKSWPEPRSVKERFGWSSVQALREGACLKITARMSGQWGNLEEVALELSPTQEAGACANCPFHPSQRVVLRPGDPGLSLDGPELALEYCQLNPEILYRYRLVGKNVYSGLADAHSTIQLTPHSE